MMKKVLFAVSMLFISIGAFAEEDMVEGRSYCRTIISDGMFGQPKGERKHCLSFEQGMAIDGADTFFGRPPERAPYSFKRGYIVFGASIYRYSKDLTKLTTVKGSAVKGTVFNLEK